MNALMTFRNMGKALVPVALALMLVACGDSGGDDRGGGRGGWGGGGGERAVRVIGATVTQERQDTRVEALGTARARRSATIYPETAGEVTEVLFSAGDYTEAGKVLVQIEDKEERLAVRLAQVSVREAEQLLARYRRIEDTGAISDSQIDEARTALDAARIRLEQAEVALAERSVIAPFAGYLGLTDVDAGTRITPQTVITRLDDRSVLFVDFDAPEQVFGYVNPGDTISVTPFSRADTALEARVRGIDSRIDQDRRTFIIRTELDNSADILRPGMSFRISFTIAGQPYPSVPEAAIVWGSDGSQVWLIEDGKTRAVPVTIVERREGRVLVRGRIPSDARVVAEGVQKVREGTSVTDVAEDAAPAPESETGDGEGRRGRRRGGSGNE